MVQTVLSIVGDVKIVKAVIVIVPYTDALSPAAGAKPSFISCVGKGAVVIIAIEMIGRFGNLCLIPELGSVHKEEVGPAVIVVIDDGDSGTGGLDDVLLYVLLPRDNLKVNAGFFCDVFERCNRTVYRWCNSLRNRSTRCCARGIRNDLLRQEQMAEGKDQQYSRTPE